MKPIILFVDDEPNIIEGLKRSLVGEPYTILSANSANEALFILEKERVDVVISDEQMPGMSGSEFLAAVRRDYPHTIRIMLTGQGNLNVAIQAINHGEIYQFLTKPCDAKQLAQTIKKALLLRRLTEDTTKLLEVARKQHLLLLELEENYTGTTTVCTKDSFWPVSVFDTDVEALMKEVKDLITNFNIYCCRMKTIKQKIRPAKNRKADKAKRGDIPVKQVCLSNCSRR